MSTRRPHTLSRRVRTLVATALLAALTVAVLAPADAVARGGGEDNGNDDEALGKIRCANLIYGKDKSSVCFSDEFLTQLRRETRVKTHDQFFPVKLSSGELYEHPFSVMTGEGDFNLTDPQRNNMRRYLTAGGFIIASAGCSSKSWNNAFEREMKTMFPERKMKKLDADHPIFHTVYDIQSSRYKSGANKLPDLYGLDIDGRTVLVWSPDGLNDTENAGGNCCCCGGNEIKKAKRLNVNILAYALTH